MQTTTKNIPRRKRSCPLDAARAAALRACLRGEMLLSAALSCRIGDEAGLRLDRESYKLLQEATGLGRGDVNRAIVALAEAGELKVQGEHGTVRVRLVSRRADA